MLRIGLELTTFDLNQVYPDDVSHHFIILFYHYSSMIDFSSGKRNIYSSSFELFSSKAKPVVLRLWDYRFKPHPVYIFPVGPRSTCVQ